jgi:crotonobetainyl-CoA:carnitine CoA-transferase CaiB-like acyl-CoA transferase
MGQLSDLFVVDLTRNVAGPLCTMYMADLGAEVIKVEHPNGGDAARYHGPPFIQGESSYYLSLNRNKKSLALDLKTSSGKEVLRRLLSRADVLINNFRPGVMERLGFDYESIHKDYPSLIYCNITGYGADGPWANRHAYDHIMQGFSGLMSVTGSEKAGNFRVGVSIGDVVTGLHALYGILAALHKRNETGQGNCVDTSLMESMISCLTFQAGHYFATGEPPHANGNDHPMISPYGTFRTKDGMINICAGNDSMFGRLCEALSLFDLAADPRFKSNPDRVKNRTLLTEELERAMITHETHFWVEHLSQSGVACGPLNNIADIFSHPQVLHRNMLMEMDHPTVGKIKSTGFPVKFLKEGPTIRNAPPALGDYTQPILRQLGFSQETISEWFDQGEVGDSKSEEVG